MKLSYFAIASLAVLALAGPAAAADESTNFVIRLGQDTIGVEHYVRSASRLVADQVGRSPKVLQRHYVYDLKDGLATHVSMVVTPPGSTTPTQTIETTVGADSIRSVIRTGAGPAQNVNVATMPGTLVLALSSPWCNYESQIMKLMKGKSDSLRSPLYLLGAGSMNVLSLHKLGKDSVLIWNDHLDVFHAAVDKQGHILGVLPISGTGKVSVQRVTSVDVPAFAASFAAREQAGAGMGILSPRDTVNASVGGASLMVDYGRPGKRGRVIYGNVVPFGDVWRTGANAATQFKTDKALSFGSTVVPAGFYTLWTIPTANGWKLVINSETGQWGTAHNAAKDLFTIDMKVSTLPTVVERFTISVDANGQSGMLNLDWDTTRASAAFAVQP